MLVVALSPPRGFTTVFQKIWAIMASTFDRAATRILHEMLRIIRVDSCHWAPLVAPSLSHFKRTALDTTDLAHRSTSVGLTSCENKMTPFEVLDAVEISCWYRTRCESEPWWFKHQPDHCRLVKSEDMWRPFQCKALHFALCIEDSCTREQSRVTCRRSTTDRIGHFHCHGHGFFHCSCWISIFFSTWFFQPNLALLVSPSRRKKKSSLWRWLVSQYLSFRVGWNREISVV